MFKYPLVMPLAAAAGRVLGITPAAGFWASHLLDGNFNFIAINSQRHVNETT